MPAAQRFPTDAAASGADAGSDERVSGMAFARLVSCLWAHRRVLWGPYHFLLPRPLLHPRRAEEEGAYVRWALDRPRGPVDRAPGRGWELCRGGNASFSSVRLMTSL